jgi:hypothetical protein
MLLLAYAAASTEVLLACRVCCCAHACWHAVAAVIRAWMSWMGVTSLSMSSCLAKHAWLQACCLSRCCRAGVQARCCSRAGLLSTAVLLPCCFALIATIQALVIAATVCVCVCACVCVCVCVCVCCGAATATDILGCVDAANAARMLLPCCCCIDAARSVGLAEALYRLGACFVQTGCTLTYADAMLPCCCHAALTGPADLASESGGAAVQPGDVLNAVDGQPVRGPCHTLQLARARALSLCILCNSRARARTLSVYIRGKLTRARRLALYTSACIYERASLSVYIRGPCHTCRKKVREVRLKRLDSRHETNVSVSVLSY